MARVLVVDDQKIPRVAVRSMLTRAGHDVETAGSGSEGIGKAQEWGPDVIILDIQMPEMDGFTVVERLKEDPDTAPIPVIFLTAETPTDELVVRGLEMGAYDFLSKGGSRAELLARVGAMARIKRSHDEMAALAQVSEVLLQTLDPDDLGREITERIRRSFRADVVLLLLPESSSSPEIAAAAGMDVEDPGFYVLTDRLFGATDRKGSGAATVVLGQEDLAGLTDPPFGSAAAACVHRPGQRSLLVAVLHGRSGAFRHPGDVSLLGLLARQASLALDNALLHEEANASARQLAEQAAHLERAMTERSRFFASMSHELRTPINAIVGFGQLLQDGIYGSLAPEQLGAASRIAASAHHLLELVNDVLDISKLEAGKIEISLGPTDLAHLVHDVATSLELQASAKGLEFSVEVPEHAEVVTDPARVRQVLLNLLSNAVKFTDAGAVRMTLEKEGDQVEVRVSDTGPGIAPEDHGRIFEEFEQTATGLSRGGTGLGLAISRRLATLLGGTLDVESEPGAGSTFILCLPVEGPPEPPTEGE